MDSKRKNKTDPLSWNGKNLWILFFHVINVGTNHLIKILIRKLSHFIHERLLNAKDRGNK